MALAQAKIYTSEDYWNLPEGQRAELIDGKLYDMAPPGRMHQKLVMELSSAIHSYIKKGSGSCEVYPAPFAVNLNSDDSTWIEPDISVICNPDKLTDKGCDGAPDWVIEITSPGNQGHDYIYKLNLYADAGVREYWIVDPMKQKILVYYFEESAFDVRQYTFQDDIKANIFEDLLIDFKELGL